MNRDKDTENLILRTAISLFGERGLNGVSTAEIAHRAGVNKALIFYYFGSKDGLYQIAFSTIMTEYLSSIKTVVTGVEPGLPMIEAFIREHITILKEHQNFVRMFLREIIPQSGEVSHVLKGCEAILQDIRTNLLEAVFTARAKGEIRDVDPLQTIVSIISLNVFYFIGKPMVRLVYPQIDCDEFERKRVDYVLDLLVNGLKKHPEYDNES